MPLRRAIAALVVCLAAASARGAGFGAIPMGKCVGASPAAPLPEGPALDLSSEPQSGEIRERLKAAGFSVSSDGRRALDAQGRPLTAAYLRWLESPADFSTLHPPQSLWAALQGAGYRLDESDCRLSKIDGGALSNWQYLSAGRSDSGGTQLTALETLLASLDALPPSAPVPPRILARMKELEKAGSALPPSVLADLAAKGATAGQVAGDARVLYQRQSAEFDGALTLGALAKSDAAGVVWSPGPAGKPGPITSAQAKLGSLLASDVVAALSRSQTGRRLLSHFRGKDGSLKLPQFLVIKTNQRPDTPGQYGAYFSSDEDTMVLNHWQAEDSLLEHMTLAEKKRFADRLSDPDALGRYLEAHPPERARVIGDIDEIFYHELVHAWQDRRSRLDVAMNAGIIPGYNPLEKEYEAYRDQMRYDFDKSRAKPDAAADSGYVRGYCGFPLLKSYGEFTTVIERSYMSSFVGMLPLQDIAFIQKERERASMPRIGDGLYRDAVQSLKMVGLWRGDSVLHQAITDARARANAFRAGDLPAMRARALGPLPTAYEGEGHFDWAIDFIGAVSPTNPGVKTAVQNWARAAKPSWTKLDGEHLFEQTSAIKSYMKYASLGILAPDAAVRAEYARGVHDYIDAILQDKSAGPAQKKVWAAEAVGLGAFLPKDDPWLRKIAPPDPPR